MIATRTVRIDNGKCQILEIWNTNCGNWNWEGRSMTIARAIGLLLYGQERFFLFCFLLANINVPVFSVGWMEAITRLSSLLHQSFPMCMDITLEALCQVWLSYTLLLHGQYAKCSSWWAGATAKGGGGAGGGGRRSDADKIAGKRKGRGIL